MKYTKNYYDLWPEGGVPVQTHHLHGLQVECLHIYIHTTFMPKLITGKYTTFKAWRWCVNPDTGWNNLCLLTLCANYDQNAWVDEVAAFRVGAAR